MSVELPTVVVTINSNDLVAMIFSGHEDTPLKYNANMEMQNQKLSWVKDRHGNEPFGTNYRALLDCDGGSLEFRGSEYKIQVKKQGK